MRILFLCLTVLLFSCSQQEENLKDQSDAPQILSDIDFSAIQERGYIIALMDNSSTGLFLYKGKTMGYEYELLKMFADSMNLGLRLNIVTNLEEAFEKLNAGEGDVMAYNLTVTKDRQDLINFTDYHNLVKLVLIQRKPVNWRDMKLHEIEKTLIRNPVELIDKVVYVRYGSSYIERMENLSDEVGGDIIIVEDEPNIETEQIIRKVAEGEINYTVAEEDIALVNKAYYPILDVETAVSFPQKIAWGVRKSSPVLLDTLNHWIRKMKKTPDYYALYNKYFKNYRTNKIRVNSEFSSIAGDKISPFDDLLKQAADSLGWDWRLLAAQIYKESKFDPNTISWAGAVGLMQVLPNTGEEYGIENLKDPEKNIYAGRKHLEWLKTYWETEKLDSTNQIKFILASYNVGHGHVRDAQSLAEKYDKDPKDWDVISDFLIKKTYSKYYNDPVVQFGYCRGIEPVTYVSTIEEVYDNYVNIIHYAK
jgi:membrane-bound lytic murein transglycosylase F